MVSRPMGRAKITVDSDDIMALRETLTALPQRVEERVIQALDDALDAVADEARDLVPKDTGELHDSIQQERVTSLVGHVRADAPHAPFIEFGTSNPNRVATPFMFPAAERERGRFVKRIKDMMKDLGK